MSNKRKVEGSSSEPPPKKASSGGLAPIFTTARGQPLPPLSNNPLSFPAKVEGTLKLATYNVNGLKSAGSKEKSYAFRKWVEAESADIIVLTEPKMPEAASAPELDYLSRLYKHRYWSAPGMKGQVAILSKVAPVGPARYGLPAWAESIKAEADSRIITLEFEKTYVVGTYVQNSGKAKMFMEKRLAWDRDFQKYISELQKSKPVIWTGDFNVNADAKDVQDYDKVWNKLPGCHPEERKGMADLIASCDLVDVWRLMNPEGREWSHTTVFASGWRLDGFIVSRSLLPRVKSTSIRHEVQTHFATASDHRPVVCVVEGDL
ncbi:hypothetical protein RQP46_000018 [Phenoliferia psychrophenolica]